MNPAQPCQLASAAASLKQQQANQRNALRSTGPRTGAGKRLAAVNAIRHGLSMTSQRLLTDPKVRAITEYLQQEAIDDRAAQELAQRIVSYERNLEHQRTLFQQSPTPTVSSPANGVEPPRKTKYGTEPEMLHSLLQAAQIINFKLTPKDVHILIESIRQIPSLGERQRKDQALSQDDKNSMRYLKRSSNQLIKALKGLKRPT